MVKWRWWWCGCEGGGVGGDEGGGDIEWKQKNKSEYGTCDKNILTIHHPSIKICTLFDETKKGIFLPPSLLYVPISPSGHLFGRHCMKYFLSKLSRSKARPIKQNIADIVDKWEIQSFTFSFF